MLQRIATNSTTINAHVVDTERPHAYVVSDEAGVLPADCEDDASPFCLALNATSLTNAG